jgi:hypothetical protein
MLWHVENQIVRPGAELAQLPHGLGGARRTGIRLDSHPFRQAAQGDLKRWNAL